MGALLHLLPGAARPGRTLTHPSLLLLATPDDYLELERNDFIASWQQAHADGEIESFDAAPPAERVIRELSSPSLFATARLIVVREAAGLLTAKDGDWLAHSLEQLSFQDSALLLATVTPSEPKGAVADTIRQRGEVRFLPLPETPKPWEEVRISKAQRQVLEGLIRRVAPAVLKNDDAVDALYESYGFKPRALAQAAERLALAGEISADAVRQQAGAGECSLAELERALIARDPAWLARFLAVLSAGGVLVDWWGEAVDSDRLGPRLGGTVNRLLRQALAVRGYTARAQLGRELDAKRCAASGWYQRSFRSRIAPNLKAEIGKDADSVLGEMSDWQLHRAFRMATPYADTELLRALAQLASSGAERARGAEVVTALSPIILTLVCRS
jgi:hypothetical protein